MLKSIYGLMLLIMLVCQVSILYAQVGEGEVNSSDQSYNKEEVRDSLESAILGAIFGKVKPTSTNLQAISLETGLVFTGYSDVRIPGDDGTLFSLSDDLKAKVTMAYRVRLLKRLGERHNVSVLAAWLNVKSTGKFKGNEDIMFDEVAFEPEVQTTGYYWFNSYRLTYRYDFINTFTSELGVGLTAKLREAGIRLENHSQKAAKTNVGFVPLINFRFSQYLLPRMTLLVEGDALAAPQGRAEDVYAGVSYKVARWVRLKLGYRMLEGGADVDETYNFALFHYATVGVEFGY